MVAEFDDGAPLIAIYYGDKKRAEKSLASGRNEVGLVTCLAISCGFDAPIEATKLLINAMCLKNVDKKRAAKIVKKAN